MDATAQGCPLRQARHGPLPSREWSREYQPPVSPIAAEDYSSTNLLYHPPIQPTHSTHPKMIHTKADAGGKRERESVREKEREKERERVTHARESTGTHFLCARPNKGVCTASVRRLYGFVRHLCPHIMPSCYPLQKIDATDAAMCTPLHCAAWKGHNDVVDVLLEAGANHIALTESGWTPLHTAAFRGHEGVTRALLGAGVDPMQRDLMGYTPFELAESDGIRALLRRAMEEYVVSPRMSSLRMARGL